uniref:Uncharacterized protein n=1 Tax=Anopheles atroparvus TaxID=41427 RepID=A0AAG5DNJ1_ANOAO
MELASRGRCGAVVEIPWLRKTFLPPANGYVPCVIP